VVAELLLNLDVASGLLGNIETFQRTNTSLEVDCAN